MDEVFARRDMIAPTRLKALSVKSDLSGALRLGGHLAALAVTGTALWLSWGSWPAVPFFIAHGVLINFLYAGQHEFSHSTVFRTKKLNEIFGRLFGFILLYPRDFDQIQHFAHHRYTQIWEKDGELARDRYTLTSYLLWVLGPTYWYTRIRRILRFSMGVVTEPYIPEDRKADVIREARWHLAGYAAIATLSIATGSIIAVKLWLLPMLVMKPVHQLQNTIEHLGLPHVDAITENTPSTRTRATKTKSAAPLPLTLFHPLSELLQRDHAVVILIQQRKDHLEPQRLARKLAHLDLAVVILVELLQEPLRHLLGLR